jgi:acyl-coenzyme A thioesterase PaaI-like protein
VLVNEGPLTLRAGLKEHSGRIATMEVKLFNGKQVLCADATVDYFVLSPEKAATSMNYPGVEAFYE